MSVRDGQNINGGSGKTLYLRSSDLYAITVMAECTVSREKKIRYCDK